MNNADDTIREQLSAWMDGELPAAEARFLERRLANDPLLRRQYERLQLASSCLKGQALRPMPAQLATAVSSALAMDAAAPASSKGIGRRRPVRWALAASVAALALFIAPGLLRNESADGVRLTALPSTNLIASPASADLVAMPTTNAGAAPSPRPIVEAAPSPEQVLLSDAGKSREESPLSLDSQSPTEFPLADAAMKRTWPRSPLASRSDPALEAYLVRHNQMLADDGLGGFVPYVDVVASEKEGTIPTETGAEADADTGASGR